MMMVMVMNFNLSNYFGGSFFNACEIIGDYEQGICWVLVVFILQLVFETFIGVLS